MSAFYMCLCVCVCVCQQLHQEMQTKQTSYYCALHLGRTLKDQCSSTDPERSVISEMMQLLKTRWRDVWPAISHRYTHTHTRTHREAKTRTSTDTNLTWCVAERSQSVESCSSREETRWWTSATRSPSICFALCDPVTLTFDRLT